MKKNVKKAIISFLIMMCATLLFTACGKPSYRYVFMTYPEPDLVDLNVVDCSEPLPAERLTDEVLDLNTEEGKATAVYVLNRISHFYYEGYMDLYYMDTRDTENPKLEVINDWDELQLYVNGEK